MVDLRTAVMCIVLGSVAVPAAPAQQDPTPPRETQQQGERQQDRDAAREQGAAETQRWIADLGSDSFRSRLQAERELRELGERALPDLRKAAEESDDPEVQWRARRLIRQIEQGDEGLVQRSRRNPSRQRAMDRTLPRLEALEQRFEHMFRDMEQRFGLDIPRGRFFHDDFFRELQEQIESMPSQSKGMTVQITPDGVRVEVQETDEEGKSETKVYEAPDLETFRSQYPGVLQRGGLGFEFRTWPDVLQRGGWQDQPFFRADRLPGFAPYTRDDGEVAQEVRSGAVLGITVRSGIPAELREHLELDADVGLMVQSVAEDSLAQELGLRAGDILVRIGDRSIRSAADVRAALAAVEAGGEVHATFLRKGAEQTAKATKPAAAKSQRDDDGDDRRLRRRDGRDSHVR